MRTLSALVLALFASTAWAAPPTVTITGQVFDAGAVAAVGTRVTFKTIGVQTLPDADKTVIPPTTFTRVVGANGVMDPVSIPKQLVVEVQVGRSQPRTIYTGTTTPTTLGALLEAYNPEIPVGNGGTTTIISGGDAWISFASETPVASGQTVYVSPGGAMTSSLAEAVFPAGAAAWSSLSCVTTNTAVTATATLYTGACSGPSSSTQTVSVSTSSASVSTGGTANTAATECVALKIDTSGTGSAYINCAAKRTAS